MTFLYMNNLILWSDVNLKVAIKIFINKIMQDIMIFKDMLVFQKIFIQVIKINLILIYKILKLY